MDFDAGWKIANALCEALGIKTPVQRIVIDCDVKGVCRVYVQGVPTREQVEDMVEALRGKSLAMTEVESCSVENGFLHIVPKRPGA